MKKSLLQSEIQEFINKNIETDISKLAFVKNPFQEVDWIEILNQIAAKSKAKSKLPTWFSTENIIYPSKISVEQTSSEKTAQYKANLVSGESLIDLTGGFGVDDYYFSKKVKQVFHCEINSDLSQIVAHNFKQLQVANIHCISGDSYDTLQNLNQKIDWIYIDPSRRSEHKGKVFMLKDCLPNVPELLDFYFEYSSKILIKTAPILDISAGLSELKNVKTIHIVALENEVKELLWEIEKDFSGTTNIKTVNISKENTFFFEFSMSECDVHADLELPQQFLYEPNAAIMKSGCFDLIGKKFNLGKLHQHSHLYTSDKQIEFPGRIFRIEQKLNYNKADMKAFLEGKKANITTRNFSDSVETIRKKWKIKDGGDVYCFFTTDLNNNKIVLLCSKVG
ncbi:MAG: class I SAM-dependent methyltransferase [Flavobacterium sp.]